MLPTSVGIPDPLGLEVIRPQVERIGRDQLARFPADKLPDLHESITRLEGIREDQGPVMCQPISEPEWRWHHVHLAIADHQVAIRA